jgi:hypothetical protein
MPRQGIAMLRETSSPLAEALTTRCSDRTRTRGALPHASAVHYRRFLLLEVPGPWGRSALADCHLETGVARRLAAAADASDVQVVLIRRPGQHPAGSGLGPGTQARTWAETRARTWARTWAWAVADTSAGVERVRWGSWRDPADLLGIDLSMAGFGATGPQRLALVCTNGKRDQCCAMRGRPVAAAVAAADGWDTWECSHLGGHRFAATLLLLPSGDMFGQLDPESAREVLQCFDAGQILLPHYRGQCGQPFPVQAALHAAATQLGDCRRGAIRASSVRSAGDLWEVEVRHRADDRSPERVYRVTIGGTPLAPALLSCADAEPKPDIRYEAISFSPAIGDDVHAR